MDITQDLLRQRFNYDPETGIVTHRIPASIRTPVGMRAGTLMRTGYRCITINYKRILEHRLIWIWMTGETPMEVDHINRIRDDNRWANLRKVTRAQNRQNASLSSRNTSGTKGVCWDKQAGRWRVTIQKNKKVVFRKLFNDLEDAKKAAHAARKRLHAEFSCHG